MKNKWLLVIIAIFASLALVSAACGPAEETEADPTATAGLPPVQPIQGSSPTAVLK